MRKIRLTILLLILCNIIYGQDSIYDIATHLHKAYDLESNKDIYLFNKIEKYYKLVLKIDSNHLSANYALGILYYNNAAIFGTKLKTDKGKNADKDVKMIEMYMQKAKYYLDRYSKLSGRKISYD